MSDDLLERLVDWDEYDEGKLNDMREEAKARIEQLTAERDEAWAYMSALQGDLYDAIMIKAERDRLREALWAILACETPNANATVTRMAAITKAALKGESHD